MKVVTDSLGATKDSCYEHGDELGLTEKQIRNLINALHEVEFEIDVDTGDILSIIANEDRRFEEKPTPTDA